MVLCPASPRTPPRALESDHSAGYAKQVGARHHHVSTTWLVIDWISSPVSTSGLCDTPGDRLRLRRAAIVDSARGGSVILLIVCETAPAFVCPIWLSIAST